MKYSELKQMSDQKLIEIFDRKETSTVKGLGFIHKELHHRENEKIHRQMLILTYVITALTAINVIVVVWALAF